VGQEAMEGVCATGKGKNLTTGKGKNPTFFIPVQNVNPVQKWFVE
jgi:hypothetical protein